MEIYLAGKSAFGLWNTSAITEERSGTLHDIPRNHVPCISKKEALSLAGEFKLSLPLEAAVARPENRRNSHKLHCTLHGASSPAHQYLRIRPGLYAARPELCLMQIAEDHSFLELVYAANVLAGCFTSHENEKFEAHWPSTSRLGIDGFLERCGKCNGKTALTAVLPYIIDNSYSPMETVLALLLHLPKRLGGYGFPSPELNEKIELASLREPNLTKAAYRPDLLWSEQRLIIEYDSAAWHAGEAKNASDAKRRNDFITNGYTVLSMTPDQLFNLSVLDELACFIADKLKRHRPSLEHGAIKQRLTLRTELFSIAGIKERQGLSPNRRATP